MRQKRPSHLRVFIFDLFNEETQELRERERVGREATQRERESASMTPVAAAAAGPILHEILKRLHWKELPSKPVDLSFRGLGALCLFLL